MKRNFLDIFRSEYEVRLSVGGHDTVAPSADQWFGISAVPDSLPAAPAENNTPAEAQGFIRALKPRIIRFSARSVDFGQWMEFCRQEEIFPHIVFPYDADVSRVEAAVGTCREKFTPDDLWEARRFYEIDGHPDEPDDHEEIIYREMAMQIDLPALEEMDRRIGAVREMALRIHGLDPEAVIILSGFSPAGEYESVCSSWNIRLVEKCSDVMDMLGVTLRPYLPAGRCWDPDSEGIEADAGLAGQIRTELSRLESRIFEAAPNAGIRIALTGWSGLPDNEVQKRQNCLFYGDVYRSVRMACRTVAINEAGPLFGASGLLSCAGGTVYANVFYLTMLAAAYDQAHSLYFNEPDSKHPVPSVHWEGIPGRFAPADIRLLEAFASRSGDGKRLFLLLINRSPFKQALARVGFYDFPDLHPAAACSIRSKNRLDEITEADPEKVFCKQIRLPKYRSMDHVTLEIPPCGCAWLLLE